MSYVCAELINGACSSWVEHSSLFPHLTLNEGLTVSGKIILCWVTAICLGLILKFTFKQ